MSSVGIGSLLVSIIVILAIIVGVVVGIIWSWNIIVKIAGDIGKLYQNFWHWLGSKLLIFLSTTALGLLGGGVFFVIAIVLFFSDPIDWLWVFSKEANDNRGLLSMHLLEHIGYVLAEGGFLLLGIGGYLFGKSYQFVLYAKLNLAYQERGQVLDYKNHYFSWTYIKKYFAILSWIGVILAIPVIIFLVALGLIIGLNGGIDATIVALTDEILTKGLYIGAWVGLVFFICLIVAYYLTYRLFFAFFVLVDSKTTPVNSGWYYLKQSWNITRGVKLLKYIPVLIASGLVLGIVQGIIALLVGTKILYWIIVFITLGGVQEMVWAGTYRYIMLEKIPPQKTAGKKEEELI